MPGIREIPGWRHLPRDKMQMVTLTASTTATLIQAAVIFHLDDCASPPIGLPASYPSFPPLFLIPEPE